MANKETKTIYDLKLHEAITIDPGICIMRVASGWIYDCWDKEKDCFKQGTFVPFDNSFQEERPKTMWHREFYGTIERSEDGCFCGKVLNIQPNLILYEGTTLEELNKDFRNAVDDFLKNK